MSSAALSKTEIEDSHKTAIEAATLTGMATATKQASTQTDSGAARVELTRRGVHKAGCSRGRLFLCQNRLLTRAVLLRC